MEHGWLSLNTYQTTLVRTLLIRQARRRAETNCYERHKEGWKIALPNSAKSSAEAFFFPFFAKFLCRNFHMIISVLYLNVNYDSGRIRNPWMETKLKWIKWNAKPNKKFHQSKLFNSFSMKPLFKGFGMLFGLIFTLSAIEISYVTLHMSLRFHNLAVAATIVFESLAQYIDSQTKHFTGELINRALIWLKHIKALLPILEMNRTIICCIF